MDSPYSPAAWILLVVLSTPRPPLHSVMYTLPQGSQRRPAGASTSTGSQLDIQIQHRNELALANHDAVMQPPAQAPLSPLASPVDGLPQMDPFFSSGHLC